MAKRFNELGIREIEVADSEHVLHHVTEDRDGRFMCEIRLNITLSDDRELTTVVEVELYDDYRREINNGDA